MSPTKNFEPHWLQILPHQCPVANPLLFVCPNGTRQLLHPQTLATYHAHCSCAYEV